MRFKKYPGGYYFRVSHSRRRLSVQKYIPRMPNGLYATYRPFVWNFVRAIEKKIFYGLYCNLISVKLSIFGIPGASKCIYIKDNTINVHEINSLQQTSVMVKHKTNNINQNQKVSSGILFQRSVLLL